MVSCLSLADLTIVIVLTMIGPEERKVDHVKEAEAEDTSSVGEKGGAEAHMEGGPAERRSEATIEDANVAKLNVPEKSIE